jgi:hypothetical protein
MSNLTGNRAWRIGTEHFQPDAGTDHKAQRQIHGNLETVDYLAYEANRLTLRARMPSVTEVQLKKMANAAAEARCEWVSMAVIFAEQSIVLNEEQTKKLTSLRMAYDELTEAYSALRRMVERSYIQFEQ